MNMTLIVKTGRAIFFGIKDLNTRANLCENNFYPESITNDNGSVAMRKKCVTRK